MEQTSQFVSFLPALSFYLFAGILVLSGVMVVFARNPVHSVLFLILCFFNAAGIFLLLGAEFLAMTMVIVYVGAVAVLFLFVVMMLDVNFQELRANFVNYVPVGGLIAVILITELILVFGAAQISNVARLNIDFPIHNGLSNAEALGRLLYTHYAYLFQVAGLILLVAMMGAVVLTLRQRPGVRRQNVNQQLSRQAADVAKMTNIDSGRGVEL